MQSVQLEPSSVVAEGESRGPSSMDPSIVNPGKLDNARVYLQGRDAWVLVPYQYLVWTQVVSRGPYSVRRADR